MGKKEKTQQKKKLLKRISIGQKLEDDFLADAGTGEDNGEDDVVDTNLKDEQRINKVVEVTFWWHNLNTAKLGFFRRERFMAKNRAFTKNLDLLGSVKEPGRPDGMFGFEEDNWNYENPSMRRLIIKWFNRSSVAHLGTLEEMSLNSLCRSMGANDTLPSFKVILPRYEFIIDLQKEHTRLRIGEVFTFPLNIKGEWNAFVFKEHRFTLGSDWRIKCGNRLVGRIDQRLLHLGGRYRVHFYDAKLYKNLHFYRTVIFFTMMLKFKKDIYKQIKQARRTYVKGTSPIEICPEEVRLLHNPRSVRR